MGSDLVALASDDSDGEDVVSFNVTPRLRAELERLKERFDKPPTDAQLFSKGITLLRIYVQQVDQGHHIYSSREVPPDAYEISVPGYNPQK
jgi:hypothetical protein